MILRNSRGQTWKNGNVAARFRRLAKLAGLPDELVPYSSRHAFATELIVSGESGPLVAQAMGHTSDQTLQRHYLHASQDVLSDMVERRASVPSEKPSKSQLRDKIKEMADQLSALTAKLLDE